MEKLRHDGVVWRLPPDKKHPKGHRVYRGIDWKDPGRLVLVCAVSDGHQFFVEKDTFSLATKETKT
jgi:hypothetical protein